MSDIEPASGRERSDAPSRSFPSWEPNSNADIGGPLIFTEHGASEMTTSNGEVEGPRRSAGPQTHHEMNWFAFVPAALRPFTSLSKNPLGYRSHGCST